MKKVLTAIALALVVALAPTGSEASDAPKNDLAFLLGEWAGTGSGQPGQGAGSFSFSPELQGKVLVRRAHSEYPAAQGRPAVIHDDLLIVYAAEAEAIYFDNEGHVIHYKVTTDPQARTATFLSVDPPPSPAFRLTYKQRSADELQVTFEISPSGKTADFKLYLDGIVVRQKP